MTKKGKRLKFPFVASGNRQVVSIRRLFVHFGVSMGMSLRFVENYWFKQLIKNISPYTPSISASTLESQILPQLGAEAREKLALEISKCPYVTCEFDGWTSMAHKSVFFLLITGHKVSTDEQNFVALRSK